MISGIPLKLGLGTRMSDPYGYVVFWALITMRSCAKHTLRLLS